MIADAVSPDLAVWSTFYAMTAASAATLTGLMFVVVTLVGRADSSQPSSEGMSTFSTPTVVHFGAALLVSAILCAPWYRLTIPAAMLTLAALSGVLHMMWVATRAGRLTAYEPDLEDWTWFTVLPFVAYCALLAGGIALFSAPVGALFVLGAGVVLLIFVGIRNSWDVVTYLATRDVGEKKS